MNVNAKIQIQKQRGIVLFLIKILLFENFFSYFYTFIIYK